MGAEDKLEQMVIYKSSEVEKQLAVLLAVLPDMRDSIKALASGIKEMNGKIQEHARQLAILNEWKAHQTGNDVEERKTILALQLQVAALNVEVAKQAVRWGLIGAGSGTGIAGILFTCITKAAGWW